MPKNLLTMTVGLLISAIVTGCGVPPDCTTQPVLRLSSASSAADHLAKAPGNSVQFTASVSDVLVHPQNSCVMTALAVLVQPAWTVSDSKNVTISSAKDASNGLATCVGATDGAVTVTASASASTGTITATSTLSCQ